MNSIKLIAPAWQAPQMTLYSTGSSELDCCLSGGWGVGAWHEMMGEGFGLGEFSVLIPLLKHVTAQKARVALIHPPYQPYAPALCAAGIELAQVIVIEPKTTQAACWAAEHCLRALPGGVVIVWTQETQLLNDVPLRRLRKAAQLGRSIGIALRPARAAHNPSPADVRLQYEAATESRVRLTCLKRRMRRQDASLPSGEGAVCIDHPASSVMQKPPTELLYLHSALPEVTGTVLQR